MQTLLKKDIEPRESQLPRDWKMIQIGGEIDLLTGFPFPSNKYSPTGVRLLRGSNVKRGITDWAEEITQYWPDITPEIVKYLLEEDDIVIAMDGSLVGKSFASLTKRDLPALLLQRVARIRSKKVFIGYLKELLCSEIFTKHCDKVKTSSAIPHISPKDIRDFQIPLPPTLAEQSAIATVLSDTDKLIRNLEQLIEKKKAIKQGVMHELLRPKKGWVVRRLGDVSVNISSGKSDTQTEDGPFPIFGSTGIIGWKLESDYFGDRILVARVGANAGTVNLVDGEYCVSDNTLMILLKQEMDFRFIYYLLKSFGLNKLVFGSGQPLITGGQLKNLPFFMPSHREEQEKVSTVLSNIDDEISSQDQTLLKYKMLKQGLMQELLTGKTRLV